MLILRVLRLIPGILLQQIVSVLAVLTLCSDGVQATTSASQPMQTISGARFAFVDGQHLVTARANEIVVYDNTVDGDAPELHRIPLSCAGVGNMTAMTAADGHVYTAHVDNDATVWICKQNYRVGEGAAWDQRDVQQNDGEQQHKSVITSLVLESEFVYSGSLDGTVLAWSNSTGRFAHVVIDAAMGTTLMPPVYALSTGRGMLPGSRALYAAIGRDRSAKRPGSMDLVVDGDFETLTTTMTNFSAMSMGRRLWEDCRRVDGQILFTFSLPGAWSASPNQKAFHVLRASSYGIPVSSGSYVLWYGAQDATNYRLQQNFTFEHGNEYRLVIRKRSLPYIRMLTCLLTTRHCH